MPQPILLIGNGCSLPAAWLGGLAKKAALVVCADGGADRALAAGVHPDVIIGDLDSVSPQTRKCCASAQWVFVDNQNNTDLEKALDWIIRQRYKSCILVGFDGNRMDFSFGNLLICAAYAKKISLSFAGPGWQLFPLFKTRRLACSPQKRVSLIPLTACQGVTLTGLKYPLKNARLVLGTTRTFSNETTGKSFSVAIKKGLLLAYLEN